jgi:hypothetical protein
VQGVTIPKTKIGTPLPNEEDDRAMWERRRKPKAEAEREAIVEQAIVERAARLKRQRRR